MVDSVAVDNLMSPAKMQTNSFMVRFQDDSTGKSYLNRLRMRKLRQTHRESVVNSPIMKSYIVLRGKVFTYDQKACSV